MIEDLPLILADERIGASGMRPKGPFRRATAANRPSIDGIGPQAPVLREALHVERILVTINLSGGFHMGIPG